MDFGEAALIICNHRTRVDWMFLWVLCLRQGQLSGLKIVLKESLKGVPGFGWATQVRPATVKSCQYEVWALPFFYIYLVYRFASACFSKFVLSSSS